MHIVRYYYEKKDDVEQRVELDLIDSKTIDVDAVVLTPDLFPTIEELLDKGEWRPIGCTYQVASAAPSTQTISEEDWREFLCLLGGALKGFKPSWSLWI